MSSWSPTSITKGIVSTDVIHLSESEKELKTPDVPTKTHVTSTIKEIKPLHSLTKQELIHHSTKACLPPINEVAKVFAVVLKGVHTVKEAWDLLRGNSSVVRVEEELEELIDDLSHLSDSEDESDNEPEDPDDIEEKDMDPCH